MIHHKTHKGAIEVDKGFTHISKPLEVPLLANKMMTPNSTLGAVYTMDHEVVPHPSTKRCDWTLKFVPGRRVYTKEKMAE